LLVFVNICFIVDVQAESISDPAERRDVEHRMRVELISSLQRIINEDAVIVTSSGNDRNPVCIKLSIDTKQDLLIW
jgi:hypothetical protein